MADSDLHVDAGRIHVAQAVRNIEAAARIGSVGHTANIERRRRRHRSALMVTGTFGASLRNSAAVSSVKTCV